MIEHIKNYHFHMPNDPLNSGPLKDFFRVESILGKGGFSTVILAINRWTKK